MQYNFPAIKTTNGLIQQIAKIQEELDELLDAALSPDLNRVYDELMDVGQAFETCCRITEKYGMNRHKAMRDNIRKNTLRGYFDEVEGI